MKKTINQINEIVKDICSKHYQIKEFEFGADVSVIDESSKHQYPYVFMLPTVSDLQKNANNTSFGVYNYNFYLIVMDLIGENSTILSDILSDTQLIGLDILMQLNSNTIFHDDMIKIVGTTSFEPFSERFADIVAGQTLKVSVQIPISTSYCRVPSAVIT